MFHGAGLRFAGNGGWIHHISSYMSYILNFFGGGEGGGVLYRELYRGVL